MKNLLTYAACFAFLVGGRVLNVVRRCDLLAELRKPATPTHLLPHALPSQERAARNGMSEELNDWLTWASHLADEIDPTINGAVDIKKVQSGKPGEDYFFDRSLFYRAY